MLKRSLKLCSMILVLAMLFNMLPLNAFAADISTSAGESTDTVRIVEEITDKRTEYTKEFKLNNGLHIAAVYSDAVHFNKDGQWAEIDNTLIPKLNGSYVNTDGVWDVTFPGNLGNGKVVIEKDGYTLSFTMAGELRQSGNLEIMGVEPEPQMQTTLATEAPAVEEAQPEVIQETEEMITEPASTEPVQEENALAETQEKSDPAQIAVDVLLSEEETVENTEPVVGETLPAETIPEESIPEETVIEETDPVETLPPETIPETEPETDPVMETVAVVPSVDTVSLSINGKAETFAISAAQSSSAALQEIDLTEVRKASEHPEMIVEKNASQLLYANVYSGTDVKYDLQSNQVKESIIMDAYSSTLRGYRYTLNVGDMIPVLQEDGSILFYDKNKENVVLFMPAPYLVDANHEYNDDIQVNLTGSNGVYSLIYILPQAWLASSDRAWPVVLDPVVDASLARGNIRDVSFSTSKVLSYTAGTLIAGYSTDYSGACRFLVKYRDLPTLTSSDVIISSSIQIYKPYNSSLMVPVEAHKVLGTWESESLTMSNMPGFDNQIEDYTLVEDSGYYTWDITDIVQGWYEGDNTGVMFKADDATEADSSRSSLKEFYSSDWGTTAYKPSLTITYRNNNGLESYWDYTSSSAGRAGTGYVNNFTGNMVWIRNDMGFGGNRMPVSINHVYNLNDAANNDFGMGYGWRTNFNQQVYQWSQNSSYYVWEDSDGTKHYFKYSSSNTYIDEDGLELTLKTNGSGTQKYSITDKNGNVSYFDTNGRLTSIKNNQATPSSITVAYTTTSGKLIDYITDGIGRKYDFTYSSSTNLLSTIQYYGSGSTALATTTFTHSSSNLTAVKDTDNKSSTYTYSGHILLTASDIDGYKLQYTYYTPAGTYQPYRVKKVAEFDGTVAGGELNFAYTHNQTTITDHNGNSEILQFNNFGNTVSIQDGLGRAQYSKYYRNNEADTAGKANQLKLSSKLQYTVVNLLADSSFESGTVWAPSGSYSTNNTVTTAASYSGSKSLLLSTNASAVGSSVLVASGESYTFSAYVKTSGKTAWLALGGKTSEVLPAGSNWTRLEVSYTNTGSTSVTVTPQISTSGSGSVYVDCVQLEKAPTASRYNLIQNGDFRNSSTGWSGSGYSYAAAPDAAAPQMQTTAAKVTGSTSSTKRLAQTVTVSGAANDTFVFAGWAKGDSASLTAESHDAGTRQFGIIATFNYTDGTTKEFVAQFNPDVDSTANWQYVAEVMVAEKAYSSIKIELAYDYNCNDVYFDGIQLYKEAFGSSYTYDDEGNLKSVVDLQNQTTTYEYTNNNLTAEILPTGARLEYVYDNYHNVTKATTEEGLVYNFTYDTYGNNTKVAIAGSPTLSSSATYTTDGNRLASTTDAAGKKTTYSYNANTNVLEWVKYPENTDATRTEYTYDNMYRMATASATTNTGLDLTASYIYDTDDTLKSITTGSTTYNFAYGNFALRSSVKAGTRTLATYTYTSDRNNYLQKLAYGNGDSVQYTYDDLGRVTKQTYEDGSTVSYVYDNSGALATVTDSATGIKTTYYYDFIDRMMKYVESGNGYSHSVGYEYDTINNLTKLVETINGVKHTTSYTYDKDNRVTTVNVDGKTVSYTYDSYGRVTQQVTKNGSTTVLTEYFTYRAPTTATTTGQIATYRTVSAGYDVTYTYTYDDNGNILSISDGASTTSYVYDTANQLVRENNQAKNYTHTWTYDDAGNILDRKEYAYTTGTLGTATNTISYTYGNTDWGDLLNAYDGQSISYDTIGNPTDDGTWEYTWQHGRQLASMTDGTNTWYYTYNADGLRTNRNHGATSYDYIYNGDKLTQMKVMTLLVEGDEQGVYNLTFAYDASGTPLTVTYNNTTYYYVTNIQGDVVGILDGSGNQVVGYTYDAWGNILETSGSMKDTLGFYNPLRYRSYVYDQESGLYYLQSRYYNPETGRFLNADAFASTGQGLLGTNMFAYGLNNPINIIDPSGTCGYIYSIYFWSDCEKYDCPQSKNYIQNTTLRTSLQVVEAVVANIDAEIAVGLGLNGNINVLDVVDMDVGIRYDLASIGYSDGSFYHIQEYFTGLEGTALIVFEFDFHSEHKVRGNPFSQNFGPWQEDTSNDIWTIWDGGLYLAGGGRCHVGLDVISLVEDLRSIF